MAELSVKDLKEIINLKINKYVGDMKLRKSLIEDFATKGLSADVPALIFDKSLDIDDLDVNSELICLTKGMYDYMSRHYGNKDLNPKKYFSDGELINYDNFVVMKEEESEIITFKDATKINNKIYTVYITAEQMSLLRRNRKYANYQGIQRPRKSVRAKNGETYEVIDSNKEGIKDLKNRFIKKDIFPTAVSFGILKKDGKTLKFRFEPDVQEGKIGTLSIKPNFNTDSDEYTPFIIVDGYHRTTGLADAWDECIVSGDKLENGLVAIISIMTEEEAIQYVLDAFKRNDVADKEALNVMKPTTSSKFINNVIESSTILKGSVVDSYKKLKTTDKLTYKRLLIDTVEYTNFKIDDEISAEFDAERTGEVIDLLINHLQKNYFDNNVKALQNTYLLQPNMFVGYLAIASKLVNNAKYKKIIGKVAEEMFLLTEDKEITKKLKLNNSKCDIKEIYNYFDNIVEVIVND